MVVTFNIASPICKCNHKLYIFERFSYFANRIIRLLCILYISLQCNRFHTLLCD